VSGSEPPSGEEAAFSLAPRVLAGSVHLFAVLILDAAGEVRRCRREGYRFGRLVVDGEEQARDVTVLPEQVVTNWCRTDGHRLVLDGPEDVREDLLEHLVVGAGIRADAAAPIPRRSSSCTVKVSRSRPSRQRTPYAVPEISIPAERRRHST
jgi:hypothetical protein